MGTEKSLVVDQGLLVAMSCYLYSKGMRQTVQVNSNDFRPFPSLQKSWGVGSRIRGSNVGNLRQCPCPMIEDFEVHNPQIKPRYSLFSLICPEERLRVSLRHTYFASTIPLFNGNTCFRRGGLIIEPLNH